MGKPFFKFRSPPQKKENGERHPAYQEGDSWQEELGFGSREIRSAIESVSKKIKPSTPVSERPNSLVWRWTDVTRKTHWDVNFKLLLQVLSQVYGDAPEGNGQIDHYDEDDVRNGQSDHYVMDEMTTRKRSDRPRGKGQSDHYKTKTIPNITRKDQPVPEGDGKGARASRERLSLAREFGLAWSEAWSQHIGESRAVAILKREGVTDADAARRILGEWAAAAIKGFDRGAVNALVWLCRQESLVHTRPGDHGMPAWSE